MAFTLYEIVVKNITKAVSNFTPTHLKSPNYIPNPKSKWHFLLYLKAKKKKKIRSILEPSRPHILGEASRPSSPFPSTSMRALSLSLPSLAPSHTCCRPIIEKRAQSGIATAPLTSGYTGSSTSYRALVSVSFSTHITQTLPARSSVYIPRYLQRRYFASVEFSQARRPRMRLQICRDDVVATHTGRASHL